MADSKISALSAVTSLLSSDELVLARSGATKKITAASLFLANLPLVGWWDASDASTITASGGAVSQWNDKSGNAYHVTQSTGAAKPTTGTRTINGLNTLDFDGGDHLHKTSGLAYETPCGLYAVVEADTVAAGTREIIHAGTAGSTDWVLYVGSNDPTFFGGYNPSPSGAASSDNTVAVSTPVLVCSRAVSVQGAGQVSLAGILVRAAGVLGTAGACALPGFASVDIGADNAGANNFDGKIGEIMWLNKPPTLFEDALIRAYLAAKWNVTA